MTFSIGLVQTGSNDVAGPADLVRQVDAKMYAAKSRAKRDGGHQIER